MGSLLLEFVSAQLVQTGLEEPCTHIVTTVDKTIPVVFTLGEMQNFSFQAVRFLQSAAPRSCSRKRTLGFFAGVLSALVFCIFPIGSPAATAASSVAPVHRPGRYRASGRNSRAHARTASLSRGHSAARRHYHGHRLTRRKKYRLAAQLDTVKRHSPTVAAAPGSTEEMPVASGSHPEKPPALALITPGSATAHSANVSELSHSTVSNQKSAPGVQNAAIRDVQVFSLSVPGRMPLALRGSHEILVHQNMVADVEGLNRIENDAQLGEMVRSGDLVALPASPALAVDERLPLNRRYCRPWTAKFLADISRAHEQVFGSPLQLTSAVRTVNFQRHLARYNGNAAPAYGETASPHLTGQAIDIGKKGMTHHEVAWMRSVLGELQNSGKLDVEEEFEQACFHISVYKSYAPHSASASRLVAHAHNDVIPTAAVAAKPTEGVLARTPDAQSEPGKPVLMRAAYHRSRRRRYLRATAASSRSRRHYAHTSRRPVVHHRRHHSSLSLLAVGMQ